MFEFEEGLRTIADGRAGVADAERVRTMSFISVAVSHWEMVVTQQEGAARLTVLGTGDAGDDGVDSRGRRVLRHSVQPGHIHAGPAAWSGSWTAG